MSLKGANGSLAWDGSTLNISGAIKATSGDFEGYMTVAGGTMKIGKDVQSTNDGIFINTNNYWYDTGNFKVGSGSAGYMSFDGTTLFVSGAISSSEGSLGGWKLTDAAIYRGTLGSDDTFTTNGGDITLGNGWISAKEFRVNSSGSAFFSGSITGGSINIGNGKFVVTNTGTATLSGSIHATGGTIGGWVVDGAILRDINSKIQLNPGTPSMDIYDGSSVKRLTVKYGALTNPASAATITIDPPSHTLSYEVITSGDGERRSSTYNTFSVSEAGTYTGTFTYGAVSNIATTGFAWSGYFSVYRYVLITDTNDIPVAYISAEGDSAFGANETINFAGGSYTFYVTFAVAGTYRIYSELQYVAYPATSGAGVNVALGPASWDDSSFNGTIQVEIAELSDQGFQVISSANSYCIIKLLVIHMI